MSTALRILHLDDNPDDAELVRRALQQGGLEFAIHSVTEPLAYTRALIKEQYDVILCDGAMPGYHGEAAMAAAREACPQVPFIVVSSHATDTRPAGLADHARARVHKNELQQLVPAIRDAVQPRVSASGDAYVEGMRYLVQVVQQLSLARSLSSVMAIVRVAARRLAQADGATFVLRDGERCFYADEDAIGPLWKGLRFPLSACISGWSMLNREAAVIEDIYLDARIPHGAYRPTFVKSLVMTPIRTHAPVGAIGVYWAKTYRASEEQTELLRTLADSTAVAIESVDLLATLEQRVSERTAEARQRSAELETLNRELEAFSYSVAHDLRAPINHVAGFAEALRESNHERLDETGRAQLDRITSAASRMQGLVEDLLALSRIVLAPMTRTRVDLSALAHETMASLRAQDPQRSLEVCIAPHLVAQGDAGLLRIVLENLLANAWKFTSKSVHARIEFGGEAHGDGGSAFFVRDNGAGFDPRYAQRLFAPFQRLHTQSQFPGSGVGLATVQRIVHRHGGTISATATPDAGACFRFTLGQPAPQSG